MKTSLTAYFYMRPDTFEQLCFAAPNIAMFSSKDGQVSILSATAAATPGVATTVNGRLVDLNQNY